MTTPIFAFLNKTSKGYILKLKLSHDLSVDNTCDLIFNLINKKQVNEVVKTYNAIKWNFK